MNRREMLFEDVYNDIVFSECDEKAMGNLFEFLEKEKFVMVKKFKDQEQNDNFHFEKETIELRIVANYKLNAIYVWEEQRYLPLEKYLKKCPRCSGDHIVQKVMYCRATKEDLKRVEEGILMFLGAAYDRFGVPEPNWKCKGCGFEWHYLYHLSF